MKNITKYALALAVALQLGACSDSDDVLSPSNYNDDFFGVPADATGPEADLRREFYKETGTHLLFTDVLRTTYLGLGSNGKEIYEYETIDFAWNLTSYNNYFDWNPTFLDDNIDEKRKGADLFRKNVLPHIKGSSMSPYSVLLLADLEIYDDWNYEFVPAVTTSCWRCLAVNVKGWIEAETDEEADKYTVSICRDLVSNKFTYNSDEAKPWFDASSEYYYEYIADYYEDWEGEDMDIIHSHGFLSYNKDWKGRPYYDEFPGKSEDFEDFFNAVFDRSEADFEAEYGDWPVIMAKYNHMKELIENTGYKF